MKATKSRLHHTTNAHEQRMKAQLPRSAAQLRSVEQREVAHFDREVDRLESDFIRMKKDFNHMLDVKETQREKEELRLLRSVSPEQVQLDEAVRSYSPTRYSRSPTHLRRSLEQRETLESLGLADGFQNVIDTMEYRYGEEMHA